MKIMQNVLMMYVNYKGCLFERCVMIVLGCKKEGCPSFFYRFPIMCPSGERLAYRTGTSWLTSCLS